MTVEVLKSILKIRNLPVSGIKADLVYRLTFSKPVQDLPSAAQVDLMIKLEKETNTKAPASAWASKAEARKWISDTLEKKKNR